MLYFISGLICVSVATVYEAVLAAPSLPELERLSERIKAASTDTPWKVARRYVVQILILSAWPLLISFLLYLYLVKNTTLIQVMVDISLKELEEKGK